MMECCATFQKCFVVCEKDPNTLLNRKASDFLLVTCYNVKEPWGRYAK